jgi:GNAT superfamily N-acetyltransferase
MRFFEIARIPVGDYGDKGNLVPMDEPKDSKPLPGGSGFSYAVQGKGNRKEIMLFDKGNLVAELDLVSAGTPVPMWSVEGIVADPDYQGRGLGMSLYGVALSILKLTLKAGDTQTVNGQRMWLKLNNIPGVEVKGIANADASEYQKQSGDTVLWSNKNSVTYTFPVGAGKKSMRSSRAGTGLYNSANASMIAQWTGR